MTTTKVVHLLSVICISTIIFTILPNDHFQGIEDNPEKSFIERIINRFYFTIITISSVGYGDLYPRSNLLKLLVSILCMYVLLIFLI